MENAIENPYNKGDMFYWLYQYEFITENWNKFAKELKKLYNKYMNNFEILWDICAYLGYEGADEGMPKNLQQARQFIREDIKYFSKC